MTGGSPTPWLRDEERELIEFRLPELGEGIESGQVIEVFVSPGDRVTLEQPLLEVETDKAAVEIPSPADGTVVDVCVSAGDTVEISQVLVKINGDDEGTRGFQKTPPAAAEEKTEEEKPLPEKEPQEEKKQTPPPRSVPADDIATSGPLGVAAAPSVRRLARELGMELSSISGTGPRGRILERDVKAHAKAIIRSVSSAPGSARGARASGFFKMGRDCDREASRL